MIPVNILENQHNGINIQQKANCSIGKGIEGEGFWDTRAHAACHFNDTVQYIYTNSQHNNPLCRVVPIDISIAQAVLDICKENNITTIRQALTP